MKDLTSTSFGLVIAFLLPGLAMLYGLSFWSPDVERTMEIFVTSNSNVGLFLLVTLAAFGLGLLVTVPRYFLFECLICKRQRLGSRLFRGLRTEAALAAFRAAVDEHYRYHQFWGGLVVVFPVLYTGWFRAHPARWNLVTVGSAALGFVGFELMIGAAAAAAYRRHAVRAREILKGGDNAQRMEVS